MNFPVDPFKVVAQTPASAERTAELLNQIVRALVQAGLWHVEGGTLEIGLTGQKLSIPSQPVGFWAEITEVETESGSEGESGSGESCGIAHAWKEKRKDRCGQFADFHSQRSGTLTRGQAYDVNGDEAEVGDIVWIRQGHLRWTDGILNQEWLFDKKGGGCEGDDAADYRYDLKCLDGKLEKYVNITNFKGGCRDGETGWLFTGEEGCCDCGTVIPPPPPLAGCCEPTPPRVLCATILGNGLCNLFDDIELRNSGGYCWTGYQEVTSNGCTCAIALKLCCAPELSAGGCHGYRLEVTLIFACEGRICIIKRAFDEGFMPGDCSCEPPEWEFHVVLCISWPGDPCFTEVNGCCPPDILGCWEFAVVIAECAGDSGSGPSGSGGQSGSGPEGGGGPEFGAGGGDGSGTGGDPGHGP